jgi:hypothetical protein
MRELLFFVSDNFRCQVHFNNAVSNLMQQQYFLLIEMRNYT